jgi:hypothetical protein
MEHWTAGPNDLKRVEKLALADPFDFGPAHLLNAVRLFSNLKELLLVASHQPVEEGEDHEGKEYHPSHRRDKWGHVEREDDLWEYLDFKGADLHTMTRADYNRHAYVAVEFLREIGSDDARIKEYCYLQGNLDYSFWPKLTGEIKEWLQIQRDAILHQGGAQWGVPKVRIVHVVTKSQAGKLIRARHAYAEESGHGYDLG